MKMYFTPGATRALDGYRDAMEAAGCIVPTDRMQDIVIEWQGCGAEVDWPDTSRSNGHLRDRASTATAVPVRLLSGDIGRDIGTLDRRMCSERGPCYIIIVSVPEDREYTYRLIANLRSPEHVSALIVIGDETYFEKRYMLSDISEIGIRDIRSLLDIQMNGFCRRRSEARRALAEYLESDPRAADATTVAGSAVSALVTASDLACREAICKVGREE